MKFNPNQQQGINDQMVREKKFDPTSFKTKHWKKRLSNHLWSLAEFTDDDWVDLINSYDMRKDKFEKSHEHKSEKIKREK